MREPHSLAVGAEYPSEFARRLLEGRFTITAELVPPVSTDPADVADRVRPLKGLAAAVNITDGAGARAHMSSLVTAQIALAEGVEPILQMTCRDRNRLALQSDLLGALAVGVRNVLVIGGDDPKAGDQPETKPVFDLDSSALLAMGRRISVESRLPSGTAVRGATSLFLGAAGMPFDPPPAWDAADLVAKAEAGAAFMQTQFCLDTAVLRRWIGRLEALGLSRRLKVLVGLAPIPSARSARWMRDRLYGAVIPDTVIDRLEGASNPSREGIAICLELLHELMEIPGVAGAHLMAPQNPAAIPEVISAFDGAAA